MTRMAAAVVVLTFTGFVSPVLAASPTGTWKSNATFNNQAAESTLKLRVDSEGSILSGFYSDGHDQRAIPITPTQFNGDKVGFTVIRELNGQKVKITFSGTLNGDTITGRSQWEVGGQVQLSEWVARRLR